MKIALTGTSQQVHEDLACHRMNNKHVKQLDCKIYDDQLTVMVIEVTPYSPDEEFENHVYGDPDHEDYLMSEDYESDCRSEQWDWLKNE